MILFSTSNLIFSNTAIVSVVNLGFHRAEVHWACDDAVIPRSNVLGHWECKKSICIFPALQIIQNVEHKFSRISPTNQPRTLHTPRKILQIACRYKKTIQTCGTEINCNKIMFVCSNSYAYCYL